jgi:hypothetical protein
MVRVLIVRTLLSEGSPRTVGRDVDPDVPHLVGSTPARARGRDGLAGRRDPVAGRRPEPGAIPGCPGLGVDRVPARGRVARVGTPGRPRRTRRLSRWPRHGAGGPVRPPRSPWKNRSTEERGSTRTHRLIRAMCSPGATSGPCGPGRFSRLGFVVPAGRPRGRRPGAFSLSYRTLGEGRTGPPRPRTCRAPRRRVASTMSTGRSRGSASSMGRAARPAG